MKKVFFLAVSIASLLLPGVMRAQIYDDFDADLRGRIDVGVEKKIVKGLYVGVSEEMRLMDMMSSLDRFHTTVDLSYKVCPYFKVGAGYTLMNLHRYDDDSDTWSWQMRHRAFLDLTGMYKTGSWHFSLRERFQLTHRCGEMNVYQNPRNEMVLRSRFKVSYNVHSAPIDPYFSVEVRNTLNAVSYSNWTYTSEQGDNVSYNDVYVNRVRFQPGLQWKVAKHHSLDFYILGDYCYDKDFDATKKGKLKYTTDSDGNKIYSLYYGRSFNTSIGVGYTYSF